MAEHQMTFDPIANQLPAVMFTCFAVVQGYRHVEEEILKIKAVIQMHIIFFWNAVYHHVWYLNVPSFVFLSP